MGIPWEKEYIAKDGRRVPILVGVVLLEKRGWACVRFVLDLTDRKRAEAALRKSEERYRALYEDIPLMYFSRKATPPRTLPSR